MTLYFQALLQQIADNMPLVLFWSILFLFILVLFGLHLSYRLSRNSALRAIKIAEETGKRSEAIVKKVEELDDFLRGAFKEHLDTTMDSFDQTVSSVLHEMKDELLHGVSRIDQIQKTVANRHNIEDRLTEDTRQVHQLAGEVGAEDVTAEVTATTKTPAEETARDPEKKPEPSKQG
jgi:hypothetical protein